MKNKAQNAVIAGAVALAIAETMFLHGTSGEMRPKAQASPRAGVVSQIEKSIQPAIVKASNKTETTGMSIETETKSADPVVESAEIPQPIVVQANDTWISADQQAICIEAGNKYGITPELLMAIIETESSGQQYAHNGRCIGLMQIDQYYHTGRMQRLGFVNLWDEKANIYTGADLLSELLEKYEDTGIALMAYNGVSNAASRTTLTEYAEKILNRAEELERIHGK